MSEVSPERVEWMLGDLLSQGAAMRSQLAEARLSLTNIHQGYLERSRTSLQELGRETQEWLTKQQVGISSESARRRITQESALLRLAERLAPGPLGMAWNDAGWDQPRLSEGSHARIGSLRIDGLGSPAPIILPFIGAPGLVVTASPDAFAGLAHSLVLRSLAAFGANRVRVTAIDPHMSSDLGLYSELRQVERNAVPAPITTAEGFERALASLMSHLGATEDLLASHGLHSVNEMLAGQQKLSFQLRLLLIYGNPGLTEHGARNLAQIMRLGGPRGTFTLIAREAAEQVAPEITQALAHLTVQGDTVTHSGMPGMTITLDTPPAPTRIQRITGALVRRPTANTAPKLPLAELIDAISDPWLDEGDDGIEVAYGRAGRANLILRLRSQDPPMPNAIVGGAVGEGKSNLLLALLYGLASKYSPQDLEFVLVDLKDGVEFARFAPDQAGRNWLPHVRVLALEFDREFALKTLEWAEWTVHDRGVKMRAAGASTLSEYRRRTGELMPRILIVIDEFQRLFDGADQDVDRAARLLESLARTARAAGVHLILASQTISGIRGLAAKSDAIFSQFHNRISLKNTVAESQAILAPRNVAAAELSHRGEVIANEALGEDPAANLKGDVAYAEKTYTLALQERLWAAGSTGVAPRIFRATSWAPPPAAWPPSDPAVLCSVIPGAPISVTEDARVARISRAPEQAVIVLGSELEMVTRVLGSCLYSAALTGKFSSATILDGVAGADSPSSVAELLEGISRRHGLDTTRIAQEGICDALDELDDRPAEAAPRLVIMLGLDAVVELDADDPITYRPRTDRLRLILRNGGSKGMVVLGWWQSRRRAEEQLGYGIPGARGFALCDVGKEDLQSICGAAARQPEGHPRITWYDRSSRGDAEVLVPFQGDESFEVSRGR